MAWKAIKAFLEEYHNTICASPKTCFREAYRQKFIDYDDFWIKLADWRNKTTHPYKEEMAEEVFAIIPNALAHFQKLLENIKKQEQ